MLRNQTAESTLRRQGHDDGYFGRPKKPPFTTDKFLAAYLAGYSIGNEQRQLEITDGTHASLLTNSVVKRYTLRGPA